MSEISALLPAHLWLFTLLVIGIIALPGMDMALVLASSLSSGRAAGWAAVAGIVAGGMAHVAMSTFGIGLLLQALPLAFNALLMAGALYVGWMGVGLLRSRDAFSGLTSGQGSAGVTRHQTFGKALITCLLNPKAYIFMLAVFPQFLRPASGAVALQAAVLGAILALTQVLIYGAVVVGAGGLRQWLRGSAHGQIVLARGVGALLVLTAAWTLWGGWRAM